jgi:hypothetical protein
MVSVLLTSTRIYKYDKHTYVYKYMYNTNIYIMGFMYFSPYIQLMKYNMYFFEW